ncbi:MAG: cupredoxin domain-containing protein [Rhodocyclaceae bacterium]|nr:cupredoxin domain-containing protein [Rhodocyclaceae bacterium]
MKLAELRVARHSRESGNPWIPAFAETTNFRALAVSVFLAWSGMLAGGNAVAAGELPTFEIVVNDGYFKPSRIEVPAGRRIKLVLVNEGPGPLEFENAEMHVEKVISAGARSFVVLPKLKPGEYEFVDEFNPITGVLTVIVRADKQ